MSRDTRNPSRRLIVNADDFGVSVATNRVVLAAQRGGVLTSASLMVNEEGAQDAAESARANPALGVGLHVVLSDGRSALPRSAVPHLVNADQRFRTNPALAGIVYFLSRAARRELRAEIEEQFRRFAATGLPFDHVNGHQHLHMHPVIWDSILAQCERLQVPAIRIPYEEFRPRSRGRMVGRRIEWLFFRALRSRCLRTAKGQGLAVADRVYGHLETGRIDESCLMDLLRRIPAGISEIYLHPGTPHATPLKSNPEAADVEVAALLSPAVRERIYELEIELTTYGRACAPSAAEPS